MTAPPYRALLKAALLVAAGALLAFGLSHAAFITWEVDRSEDPSLVGRLAQMFFVPVAVGAPFALAAALLGAHAWRATREWPAFRSWRYGAVLATSLAPPVVLALAFGSLGDDVLRSPVFALAVALAALVPATIAALLAREWRGLAVGPAALVLVAPWSLFILGEGVRGWVVPFVLSIVAILVASGWAMERLVERWASEPFSGLGGSPSS